MTEIRSIECERDCCPNNILPQLYEMGRAIARSRDLQESLTVLLAIMRERLGVAKGLFTLYHRRTGTIFIHEGFGVSDEEKARGVYNLGEGITGKVVESGKPIVVPRIREEPNFLNRTQSRDDDGLDRSFLCIPIVRGTDVLGTISVEKDYADAEDIRQDVAFLEFLATLLAQAVEIHLLEHEEKTLLESENRRLREALKEKFHPANIIGNSAPMREVYAMIEKIAKTRVTVLLLGESGVGKELVANAIHYHGNSAGGPFVKFNCAALPESVIESELFGHEKGAFTGAETLRKGRFEEADGGTIFIDEIGELSPAIQTKLLRVLQERTVERVGRNKPIPINIRVLTATNRDLKAMVDEGKFREDLYYRLNVFPVTIPPLRERGGDIVALADSFVERFAKENGKTVKRISRPALQMLTKYFWPGNVRELENVIERAVILCEDEVIHGYNLPPSLQDATISGTRESSSLRSKLDAVEYEYVVEALKHTRGNVTEAARELGLTRRVLGLKMQRFGVNFADYRKGSPLDGDEPETVE